MEPEQKYEVIIKLEVMGKEYYSNTSVYKNTTKETVLLIESELIEMAKRLNSN